ncbi:ParB N-terminal domain-containing protein [Microcoleus sp. FACHB-831]|uniref:ParB/RepB/Spo0J family partition protein n=1 Tax=Microcoleus sp. FACHB-831 TaxID=2692827 RepID=UPI001682EA1C|nr:ParB N-terminal domain-containing protein [Microcoleus sp. FACHB-831]MBD1919540.1 ParB N-terminal domain-containing protein [Microcoleus sp. FACHB-831]
MDNLSCKQPENLSNGDSPALEKQPSTSNVICECFDSVQYLIGLSTKEINPLKLTPHPTNAYIYGLDEDVSDLVELIKLGREIRPLIVTPSGTIISGHRRNRAAIILGWSTVPVEVKQFDSPMDELALLLRENTYRNRTVEQRIREGWYWELVEVASAKQRQVAGLKQNQPNTVRVNLPERIKGKFTHMENVNSLDGSQEARRTRNRVSVRVGLGGSSYDRASKVLKAIDLMQQDNPELANAWKKVLNKQSIDAAYKLLKSPSQWRERILQVLSTGLADTTIKAIAHLKAKTCALNPNFEAQEQPAGNPLTFAAADLVQVNLSYMKNAGDLLKWNGYWGEVLAVSLTGILTVNMGASVIKLMGKDVLKIDGIELNIAQRVLELRKHKELSGLDELILNFIQKQHCLKNKELEHLQLIESRFYSNTM